MPWCSTLQQLLLDALQLPVVVREAINKLFNREDPQQLDLSALETGFRPTQLCFRSISFLSYMCFSSDACIACLLLSRHLVFLQSDIGSLLRVLHAHW